MTVVVQSGRNRRIPGRMKRAATHAHRSRWLRLASRVDSASAAPLAAVHETRVFGSGDAFHATCSCGGFATRKPTAERYARGAAIRHLNTVRETGREAA